MKVKKNIFLFSGGLDSSFLLQQLCKNRKIHECILINIQYISNKFNNKHFLIAQILYNMNIDYFIVKHNLKNLKSFRKLKYNKAFEICCKYNIRNIIIAHQYTDCIENFLMRFKRNGDTRRLITFKKINFFYFICMKIKIIRPIFNLKRNLISKNDNFLIKDNEHCERIKFRKILNKYNYKFIPNIIKNINKTLLKNKRNYIFFKNYINNIIYHKQLRLIELKTKFIMFYFYFLQILFRFCYKTSSDINKKKLCYFINKLETIKLSHTSKCNISIFSNKFLSYFQTSINMIKITKYIGRIDIILNNIHKISIYSFYDLNIYFLKKKSKIINLTKNNNINNIIRNNDIKIFIKFNYFIISFLVSEIVNNLIFFNNNYVLKIKEIINYK